jgi:hypothetical protein
MTQPGRRRIKISATLDPDLLHAVDTYVNEHPGSDRSRVLDQAVALWYAAEQERAMIEQFGGQDAPEDERQAWRSIQREAARRRMHRDG